MSATTQASTGESLGRRRRICRFLGTVKNTIAANEALVDLDPLRKIDTVIEKMSNPEVPPFAKLALRVLSSAAKMILEQVNCKPEVRPLLVKLVEIYGFMSQEMTHSSESMLDIVGQVAEQTLECAWFMNDYSEPKNFWKRVRKNVASETEIQRYNEVLDMLKQNILKRAGLDLGPLITIDTVIGQMIDVPPFANLALRVFSSAAKMILEQVNCEQEVWPLLVKLVKIYGCMSQEKTRSSMLGIVGQVAHRTLECACFMRDYSETKKSWERAGKNVPSTTKFVVKRYIAALDKLMETQEAHRATIFVQRTNISKQCLPGTRTDILSKITKFINNNGDGDSRVLWLSGPAGTGKSAIAHTIAHWSNNVGVPVSCFCFDRDREADRHEKIFATIARDLADCDPKIRKLMDAVMTDSAVKNTTDIIQQWQRFIMQPLRRFSALNATPIVIVIDALDKSSGVKTRQNLLRILAGTLQYRDIRQITELPNNVRFVVTSRPLRDIDDEFDGAQHIQQMSMDDIPIVVAERDIRLYLSQKLKGFPFGDSDFAVLAEKAEGLFEWARLACEGFIEARTIMSSRSQSFGCVITSDPGMRRDLLSDMYLSILEEIMRKDVYPDAMFQTMLVRFHSVMGQILGLAEPLPLHSLNAMRRHFPDSDDHYKVEVMVNHMGSLLSGTTKSDAPIRLLHTSFGDFLTDKTCSGDFFVDMAKARRNLAFASLRVMEDELRFNICNLKSSYIPNREDHWLPDRVEKYISPHLSYSCRLWATHIRGMDFDTAIAENIRSFFDSERLLFWFEALGLLKAVSRALVALPLIIQWLKTHSEYEDVLSAAMDAQSFIQTFGGIILYSTPHLYISALPFSSINPAIYRKFSPRFPNTLRLTSGRDENWPAVQSLSSGHTAGVLAISLSPDGTRIATGSYDKTVRLWDAATGQPVGKPLLGHTDAVNTVSFSTQSRWDETHIVSGSSDHTVRLWEAATGRPVGEPLQKHTGAVNSVSFSPNGSYIGSGSSDLTIWVWDVETRKPIKQLCGHTARVNSVSFSCESNSIVSGSDDKTIRLWKADKNNAWDVMAEPISELLLGHTSAVTSVSLSLDGSHIASGSFDKTVRLWNFESGKSVGEPLRGHTACVNSVSFSLDGTHIVSGSSDNTVRLWKKATGEAATWEPVGEPLRGHTSTVNSVLFSSNGNRIISGSVDNAIRLWYATIDQPEEDSTSVDRSRTTNTINDGTLSNPSDNANTWNNQFICFSSNLGHALPCTNSAELIEGASHGHSMSASFSLGADGWMVGPEGRLLFWVPLPFRRAFHTPWTAMVIPGGQTELDLSDMKHGKGWHECQLGDKSTKLDNLG